MTEEDLYFKDSIDEKHLNDYEHFYIDKDGKLHHPSSPAVTNKNREERWWWPRGT